MPNKVRPHALVHGRTSLGINTPVLVDATGIVQTSGGGSGSGAVTIADAADTNAGAIGDVAVVGDNIGTLSAKLRGLNKILNDVWDSVNHWFKVSIQNATLAVTQSGTWTVTTGLGSLTPAAPTFATVGTSEAEALAASAGRKMVELVNTSSNFISLSFGANAAVLNRGWTLTPYGTRVIDNPSVAALAIRAIASDVSSNLGIQTYS